MEKTAVFLAGDINIVFPAFVALNSIQNRNSYNNFDYFICIDISKVDKSDLKVYKKSKIHVVDINMIKEKYRIKKMSKMKNGWWPEEIMINWVLPHYLNDIGYSYSIKIDYDILCVGHYNMDEIVPKNEILTGLVFGVDIWGEGFNEEAKKYFIDNYNIETKRKNYINAGFVVINNKKYVESNFFYKLSKIYEKICSLPCQVKLEEQAALCLTLSTMEYGPKELPEKYNARVINSYETDSGFNLKIKNIHYITRNKPWVSFNPEIIKSINHQSEGKVSLYRAYWLEIASKSKLFKKYCSEPILTEEQKLGVALNAYSKMERLKTKIDIERNKHKKILDAKSNEQVNKM